MLLAKSDRWAKPAYQYRSQYGLYVVQLSCATEGIQYEQSAQSAHSKVID
jgi:hypothetical protein